MKLDKDRSNGSEYHHYTDVLNRDTTLVRSEGILERVVFSLFKDPVSIGVDDIKFAVLGDLHGHLTDALGKLKEWVNFCGCYPQAILQVGDLGAFDYTHGFDATTKKMSRKDPQQLGFLDYFYGSEIADSYFGKNGCFRSIPFYFVDGNHDNLNTIISMRNLSCCDNLTYLKSGELVDIGKDTRRVSLCGIGWHDIEKTLKRVEGRSVDILLTHTANPYVSSPEFRDFGVSYNFHFFGHHRDAPEKSRIENNSYGLSNVRIERGHLNPGSMGWLSISPEGKGSFIYLPEKISED